jgi:large subunit ribosomal protein L10
MNRDKKASVIEEVAAQIREAQAVYAVDYRGLSVKQAGALRDRLLEADATFRVVKNTLTERAAERAGAEGLKAVLDGPTALTFVRGDAAVAAKALATFRRETNLLQFKGGTLDGDTLSVEQVEFIARLPARELLQAQFVGVLAAPITGLVRGLNGLLSGLAVALGQIQEKGLIGGGAAPAPVEEAPPSQGPVEAAAQAPAAGEDAS